MPRLFVANISFSTKEADVLAAFSPFGTVESVEIITDRHSGVSHGFAYVEMTSREDAQRAISKLHGAHFRGRTLMVDESRPKPVDSAGG